MCLRKIYTLLLLNGESYRCLFDLIGVWFMQIFCLCCTSAQLFYPLFKENIEICNYYCFNYFSTQCFHFLFCVFRGSVIRYIHVCNCYMSSDCHFNKRFLFISDNSALFLFNLAEKSRALCFFYGFNSHGIFSSSFAIKFFVLFDQRGTPIAASCVSSQLRSLHFD